MPLALVPPAFRNLSGGFVQPVLINRQAKYLDGGKPFRCVRGRIAKRRQFAQAH